MYVCAEGTQETECSVLFCLILSRDPNLLECLTVVIYRGGPPGEDFCLCKVSDEAQWTQAFQHAW